MAISVQRHLPLKGKIKANIRRQEKILVDREEEDGDRSILQYTANTLLT